MKTKHIAGILPAFALMVFWFANAYATFDSHVHTGNGPIDTWPTISPSGTHNVKVCAPTSGTITAYLWTSEQGQFARIVRSDGASGTTSTSLTSRANILFASYTDRHTSGVGKAYLADAATYIPPCGTGN
ncbi:hypothetical protein HUU59_13485 [bacterium]|nr:hypothetical protein [bacterium]